MFVETFDTLVQPIGFQVLKADSHKALEEKQDAYTHGLLVGRQTPESCPDCIAFQLSFKAKLAGIPSWLCMASP